jgi:cell division protein FtsQ
MGRKILMIFIYICLTAALVAYFCSAQWLVNQNIANERCRAVHVTLLDSSLNKFVSKSEVLEIINSYNGNVIGKRNSKINLGNLENLLNMKSAVKESQISLTRDGILNVQIKQRKPVLRIETENGGFYIDEDAFVFPLIEKYTSYVPIATGYIPISITPEKQTLKEMDSTNCIRKLLKLGKFLADNPFWNAQIEQIYFQQNGDVAMYTRIGKQRIVFGDLDNIPQKFKKLYAFYKYVIPNAGWDKYSTVNLKFKKQIVCTIAGQEKAWDVPADTLKIANTAAPADSTENSVTTIN